MNVSDITAKVRELFLKHGTLAKLPAEAKALVRQYHAPAAVSPRLLPPEETLAAIGAALGLGARGHAEADFRANFRRRLARQVDDQMATLGFPVAADQVSSAALPEIPRAEDTVSNRLAFVASELGCPVDILRAKTGDELRGMVRNRVSVVAGHRLAEMAFPLAALPANRGEIAVGGDDSLEDVQTQMKDTKDPVQLGRMAARANALRNKQWANSSSGAN